MTKDNMSLEYQDDHFVRGITAVTGCLVLATTLSPRPNDPSGDWLHWQSPSLAVDPQSPEGSPPHVQAASLRDTPVPAG